MFGIVYYLPICPNKSKILLQTALFGVMMMDSTSIYGSAINLWMIKQDKRSHTLWNQCCPLQQYNLRNLTIPIEIFLALFFSRRMYGTYKKCIHPKNIYKTTIELTTVSERRCRRFSRSAICALSSPTVSVWTTSANVINIVDITAEWNKSCLPATISTTLFN